MIKDGLIQPEKIDGIPIKVSIIQPRGIPNVRTMKPMTPKGITVHNTGNTSPAAGALAHGQYLQKLEDKSEEYKSWHITVSHDRIVQHLPLTEQGYHAGDGKNGYGNMHTIGIEIAENKNYETAEKNTIKLIVTLMRYYGFEASALKPHRYYSHAEKLCPRRILLSEENWQEKWEGFLRQRILSNTSHYNSMGSVPDWGKKTIEKLIAKGYLMGDGDTLGLTLDMIRTFVIHDRAGLYD
ncbi:MAG: N-acetylmuramoyl-L-alanine amidase [Eubacteriales bacterium]|nr:N-acetylmuramoyl-L-alanine amidase [Eubacteriales bacterium]